jgi:two-component system, chemotaxis family, CheB/CheR fusion protein
VWEAVADQDPRFERLLQFLKESRGFDFTGYKRTSLMRRINRRMQDVDVPDYDEYVEYLEVHPEEFTALFNAILINVTGFFRDTDVWSYLREEEVPEILRRVGGEEIRVWSAGCASGQEAYSLAIMFAELLGVDDFRRQVKIYATDVDEEALTQARQAVYGDREMRGLTQAQIEQYFEQVGTQHNFRKDLRRSVIFGRNDLIQDAPISRIDLLVCRNTLMYFNAETQGRILQRLHFALNPRGVLFLGKAEMLLSRTALFTPIDLKRRLFRKVPQDQHRERVVLVGPAWIGERAENPMEIARVQEEAIAASPIAQIVLDKSGRLATINRRAEGLFALSQRDLGRPFQDLEVSYRPAELRSSISNAMDERRPVWLREVELRRGNESIYLDIQVAPLVELDGVVVGVALYFNDITRYRQLQGELEYASRQMELAYEELQSTNEELETTNEELQSTVEELETTNEELQSTNEELETMNEELQSMNDELQSSNDELRERTQEVGRLNAFMGSILTSLRAGVIVVDRDLRVLVWNARSEDLWGLRHEEVVGQHVLNLDIGLPLEQLRPMMRRVINGDRDCDHEELTIPAVNRRGRKIMIRVTGTPLVSASASPAGAILVMDQQDHSNLDKVL